MKNVVVIGGGTGVYTVLSGLKKYPYHLCAIVSMSDNGGSTGTLREEFGMLPPGDIRRALVALSGTDNKILSELFNYRFENGGGLKGHSMGNLLLTALEKITGSFENAVKEAVRILNVKGDVVPVTLSPTSLCAELENGLVIEGETNIDIPKHDGSLRIKRIFLEPEVSANPEAVESIKKADFIVLGPGDLYTSILPNIIIKEIKKALTQTRGKIIYVVNVMNKYGETYKFKVSDFIDGMEVYLGKNVIDFCLVNTQIPQGRILERYHKAKDDFVQFDKTNIKDKQMKFITGKFLRKGQFLRHDPQKLADAISSIIKQ
jgi:uncharacterized cofD-like protein